MDTAILIIAAGSSSRLGQIKQLLEFKNSFLLQEIINECLFSKIGDVYVVLGANGAEIENRLNNEDIQIVHNPNWKNGMGNSIGFGLSQIKKDYDQVIIVLGDQVYFTRSVLKNLMAQGNLTGANIVQCSYQVGQGPPVLFNKSLFADLLKLDGDNGAKSVIRNHEAKINFIEFSNGHLDIDKEEDLHLLNI